MFIHLLACSLIVKCLFWQIDMNSARQGKERKKKKDNLNNIFFLISCIHTIFFDFQLADEYIDW